MVFNGLKYMRLLSKQDDILDALAQVQGTMKSLQAQVQEKSEGGMR